MPGKLPMSREVEESATGQAVSADWLNGLAYLYYPNALPPWPAEQILEAFIHQLPVSEVLGIISLQLRLIQGF